MGGSPSSSAASAPVDLNNSPLPPPGDTAAPTPEVTTTDPAPSGTTTSIDPTNLKSSCTDVVHVGDSTSIGLMSKDYLPNPSDRIDAQYKQFGVAHPVTDIAGARSIVERWNNQPNAEEAVQSRIASGYKGCWVFAMGTNEAANQVVGGTWPFDKRIDLLMQHVGNAPVMFLTVKTLLTKGPYAESGMQQWDDALVQACQRYPNMRVYDWAAEVQDSWYAADKTHFTTPGYQQRARRTAEALALAFPKGGTPPANCLIRIP
jgi:hypothetical protein